MKGNRKGKARLLQNKAEFSALGWQDGPTTTCTTCTAFTSEGGQSHHVPPLHIDCPIWYKSAFSGVVGNETFGAGKNPVWVPYALFGVL
ncbi:hypothetical protein DPV78_004034 [Talaromyces pinophilus]|nr:hypothetical protein DPV78_004034 [Talaromyces pinophilus]